MHSNRKVILYIAMSLDGYIAKSDDDISFLSSVEQEGEDYGYVKFLETVDTVILGRKTYDKVISMGSELPYPEKDIYILTRTPRSNLGNMKFYTGNLSELVSQLKSKKGKNIYCDGGAETVHQFLLNDLFDELIISVVPVILGNGIQLFGPNIPGQKFLLEETRSFEKGLVQLHYIKTT